jgi:spermidine/putrescine transport system substrate-binding protein
MHMTHDPRLDHLVRAEIQRRYTRRRFLGRMGLTAGALAIGPAFLAACGDDGETSSSTTSGGPTSNDALRISNWPGYMVEGFVADFEDASGLSVDYREDFNDNEQWFAKYSAQLQNQQDIGADLVVPTDFMVGRLVGLGWLNEIDAAAIPNKANLRPDLQQSAVDPDRAHSLPWMSGLVGLGYNRAAVGRTITGVDDLFDPEFAGQVSMLSDLRDGVGMVMLWQGNDPAEATDETVQQAIDAIREQTDNGQIRKFTGNDYMEDLAAGNLVIAEAYSGDVVQLQADNPDLEFVFPDAGGTGFVDSMVIPYTTRNQVGAEEWMDYVYDRDNYAKLIAYVQYVPVLSDMTDALSAIDPALAEDPLINPPADVLERMYEWPVIPEESEQAWVSAFAEVTGG